MRKGETGDASGFVSQVRIPMAAHKQIGAQFSPFSR